MPEMRVRFRVDHTPYVIDWQTPNGSQVWGLDFGGGELILEFDTLDRIEAFARDLLKEVTRDA